MNNIKKGDTVSFKVRGSDVSDSTPLYPISRLGVKYKFITELEKIRDKISREASQLKVATPLFQYSG